MRATTDRYLGQGRLQGMLTIPTLNQIVEMPNA